MRRVLTFPPFFSHSRRHLREHRHDGLGAGHHAGGAHHDLVHAGRRLLREEHPRVANLVQVPVADHQRLHDAHVARVRLRRALPVSEHTRVCVCVAALNLYAGRFQLLVLVLMSWYGFLNVCYNKL